MIKNLDDILEDIRHKKYWYFGKHSKDFIKMCYAVDLINGLPPNAKQEDFEQAKDKFNKINEIKLDASMFKSLISTKMYGLLDNSSKQYVKCQPTDVFNKIKEKTEGNFCNTTAYYEMMEQQIEKIFYKNEIFLSKEDKGEFQLYPIFLLYKILLEVGNISGDYKITNIEFDYFVATAKKYEDWRNVVDTIIYHRNNTKNLESIIKNKLKEKNITAPDQRYYSIIKQLKVFDIGDKKSYIKIKPEFTSYIKSKINTFEILNAIPSKYPGAIPNGSDDFHIYLKYLGQDIGFKLDI